MSCRRLLTGFAVLLALLALLPALGWLHELWLTRSLASAAPLALPAERGAQLQRGAYLARIGNCAGCHTARGGPAYAGGMGLQTPFGTVFASNLTPHPRDGLGGWSADDFWRALHHGRSRDGRLLYPAFPYPSMTQMTRADADALFAWLQTLAPVEKPNRPHELDWPYRSQTALAVWRLLYFRPGQTQPAEIEAPLARGRYLVQAVAHCAECHAPRNRWGALQDLPRMGGGLLTNEMWTAPSLHDAREAGLKVWNEAQLAQWLRSGWSAQGVALGPMASVIGDSLRHLTESDARAMAQYLLSLPAENPPRAVPKPAPTAQMQLGARVYRDHCASCHGSQGQGLSAHGTPAYPALAGNRTALQDSPLNLLQVLANGAYAASTPAHPRPYGMPPFRHALSDAELAAVASFVRQSWGNAAAAVSELELRRVK